MRSFGDGLESIVAADMHGHVAVVIITETGAHHTRTGAAAAGGLGAYGAVACFHTHIIHLHARVAVACLLLLSLNHHDASAAVFIVLRNAV